MWINLRSNSLSPSICQKLQTDPGPWLLTPWLLPLPPVHCLCSMVRVKPKNMDAVDTQLPLEHDKIWLFFFPNHPNFSDPKLTPWHVTCFVWLPRYDPLLEAGVSNLWDGQDASFGPSLSTQVELRKLRASVNVGDSWSQFSGAKTKPMHPEFVD